MIVLKVLISLKYSDAIIDHKLNLTQHVAQVKNKISKGISTTNRAKSYLPKNCFLKLYFIYIIYPFLIYCFEI